MDIMSVFRKFAFSKGSRKRRSRSLTMCALLQFAVAIVAVISIVGLVLLRFYYKSQVDFAAIGQFLLVLVIATNGIVAIAALSMNQKIATSAANGAVFDLYKIYLSVDYHQEVRRPAWYALSRARRDPAYYYKILAGLGGEVAGDEVRDAFERARANEEKLPGDNDIWQTHDEYHRVLDILGFFGNLSAWGGTADSEIFQTCNFFYDRWRVPLHMIVRELGKYTPSTEVGESVLELKQRRYDEFNRTLNKLDDIFNLKVFDWKEDPLSKLEFTEQGRSSPQSW